MSHINIFSPTLHPAESYGIVARHLSGELQTYGASVNAVAWGNDVAIPVSEGTIYLGPPTMFPAFPVADDSPRIAISMWESTILPAGWTDILNTMDAVIVPSQFCYDVFKACGVTVPLYKVRLGIGEIYQPVKRTSAKPMRFLAFLDRGRRKGGHVALAAFQRAFGDNPDYRLVLKVRENVDRVELFDTGNIELIQRDMTEQELYELYQSCDVFIGANSCEGFGLLPREFAATGGIALATNWGGTADDITDWGWPIPYQLVTADWSGEFGVEGQQLGDWAAPDVEAIVAMLRHIATYRDCYAGVAYENAGRVHDLYSWKHFAQKVLSEFLWSMREKSIVKVSTDLASAHNLPIELTMQQIRAISQEQIMARKASS